MKFSDYTTKNIDKTLRDLNSSEKGLSEKEVEKRQQIYGLNEVRLKETGLFDVLLRQFKSPFFYLLFIVSIISFAIGDKKGSLVIFVFIFINVSLGFFQEARAVRTASILKKFFPLKTKVIREGEVKIIEQELLVPGDIVLIEAGNIIPADLRLIKAENLVIDESILSGESVPVPKVSKPLAENTQEIFEAKNTIFAGTSVISGESEGIVIATGKNTAIGEIAKLTTETVRESTYEKDILRLSRVILRIVVVTGAVVYVANLAIKGKADSLPFLSFSIALIVSIIPEALPVVVTSALSQGALRMAKKKVIVKRLSAVEDLGDIEILCTDKTGTITENKLWLHNIYSSDKNKCLLYGLLASTCMEEGNGAIRDPFDLALLREGSGEVRRLFRKSRLIFEIPFDSSRMRNSHLIKMPEGEKILIVRGAPEVILRLSSNFEGGTDRITIQKEVEREGKEGKRALAIGFKKFERDEFTDQDEIDLTFLGYFSFHDPLKNNAKKAIQLAKEMGVQIKIITGDSKEVAGKIGKEVGIIDDTEHVILGETLDSFSSNDFEKACRDFSVFARISPKTKYKIVESLQKKYEVGFLGEGINDAPALKIANVAIAVREGTDISREVSDIILIQKDLRILIEGIEEGRKVFSNINKYIKCTLASNFGNFYSIAAISLFIPFLPMLPVQILIVNLLSDFPLIAVASDSIDLKELKKPKLYKLEAMIFLIFFLALISTIFDFVFFGLFFKSGEGNLQTLWFIESIVTEILLIFSIRTSGLFFKAKFPSFPLMFFAILTVAATFFLPFTKVGQEFFHFVSPSISSLMIVVSLLVSYFFISEIVKLIYFKHYKNKNNNHNNHV
jgi:Mg2+-importing ATPase